MRIKTLNRLLKLHAGDMFTVPRTVQQTVPITAVWSDGIFQHGQLFSMCWRFSDINYAVANHEDQEVMFLQYSDLLNALDVGSSTKFTILNHRFNRQEFDRNVLLPARLDSLDALRAEYNDMLSDKATSANNNITQDKVVTITAQKKSIEDARSYFARIGADLNAHFQRLGSIAEPLELEERLRLFHDFFRAGHEEEYHPDFDTMKRQGHSIKNYVCPDSMEITQDWIRIDGRYARAVHVREYANYIKDNLVTELSELNKTLSLSIDIIPVSTDEAVRASENVLLGVETNITNFMRKQTQRNNFSAVIPYDMEIQRKEAKEFLDDLLARDQKMMFVHLTLVHMADTLEELDADTEALLSVCRKQVCQASVLKFQQLDGLNTALPYGLVKLKSDPRTMTTESAAVLMPFRAQDVLHPGGIYYGLNTITRNMLIVNRKVLLNGNGFILGVSGSGKSFKAKEEMSTVALSTEDDLIVLDPQGEYAPLIRALGGEIIRLGPSTGVHINPLDMSSDYNGAENPIGFKSDFLLSLVEQIVGTGTLSAKEKSIIDRVVARVYQPHIDRGYIREQTPTLMNFYATLKNQPEDEAKGLALSMELYIKGSLNTFAQATNVDTENRIVCYDIRDLGKNLQAVGMLVVLDAIMNRISRNHAKGRRTWVYIDEIYVLFANQHSSHYMETLWRQIRKFGGYCTGITQNVTDLLQSQTARAMLSNSEFIVMLNQAALDRGELAKLLGISDTQLSYITNPDAGRGLLRCGGSIVPFEDKFPKDTQLYRLMTTKPDEQMVS